MTMHDKTARCPVDFELLDDHTNSQMLRCEEEAVERYDLAIQPSRPLPNVHSSWNWRLPERFQG